MERSDPLDAAYYESLSSLQVDNLPYNVIYTTSSTVNPPISFIQTIGNYDEDILRRQNAVTQERAVLREQLKQAERDKKLQPGEAKRIIESL